MKDPYIEKNRGFITSSKIKEFIRCQRCFKLKYIDEVPDPTEAEEFEERDHFLIGQAIDDYITKGDEEFNKQYRVVARRNKKAADAAGVIELTNTHWRTVKAAADEFYANTLFQHKVKKEVIELEFGGLKIRAELDDINHEQEKILDLKSTANILTFDPEDYLDQMTVYNWLVEEKYGKKYDAMLEVMDKYKYFSRSIPWIYNRHTLEANRGKIMVALGNIKEAMESGIYAIADNQTELFNCPYYKDHGRPIEPKYY
jgi:hypothetical protein